MSTQPQLSPLEQLAASGQPQQSATPSPQPQSNLSPLEQLASFKTAQPSTDPSQTGEITNDVGQKVIVPKDGESFQDTMKRAVQYHNSLTPEQQQAALDAESATAPKKAAQTLGAAATIGAVGPAVMAVPGEVAAAIPDLALHTINGVKALGTWASANPLKAYMLYNVLKEMVPGAKKAIGFIHGVPDGE